MKLSHENLKIIKVVSGFFYEQDFRYSTLKGEFFNKAKQILQLSGSVAQVTLGIIDVLKSNDNPDFELRTSDQYFNYEDKYTSRESLLEKSLELANRWQRLTGKPYTKIGGVVQFELVETGQAPVDFVFKYYREFMEKEKIRSSKLHINFYHLSNGLEYNVNLTVQGLKEPQEKLSGVLDINRSDSKGMNAAAGESILKQLFAYYDKYLLDFLNYEA